MAITPLPPAPLPSDTPTEFNVKAFDLVAALDDFVTEANAQAVAVDADAASADADAATATTKANEASASADLAEDWATKTSGTVDGTEFSAKKYAQDSSDSADESAASALEAAGLVENYQGALASDPSLNKDGGALQAGDWYVNTATGLIRAYTGSVWVTSVNVTAGVSSFSAGTTGFTPSTGTQGDITLSGTLAAINGGTGLTAPGTTGNVLTSNGTAWTSSAPAAGTLGVNVQTFNTSGTWTKPAGYTANSRVLVELWGGGGSGRYVAAGAAGSGGGGGGYNFGWFFLSDLGSTETATVAAGGASQTSSATDGNNGGTSSFGSFLSAFGGGGGPGGNFNAAGGGGQLSVGNKSQSSGQPYSQGIITGGNGEGSGGNASLPGTGGMFKGGGASTNAQDCLPSVYGGGGGVGCNSSGAFGAGLIGGTSVFGGAGGRNSAAGTQPGGGGSAGYDATPSGAGGDGRIRVTVFAGV